MLWICLLVASAIKFTEGSNDKLATAQPCQGSGEPCIEFVTQQSATLCSEYTDLQLSNARR